MMHMTLPASTTAVSNVTSTLSHISIDWLILFVLVVLLTIDALRAGSGRTAAIALALPIAGFIFEGAGHTALISTIIAQATAPAAQAGIFIALCIGAYFIINRMMPHYDDISGAPLLGILAGVASAIAIVSTWVHLSFLATIWHFGPSITHLFDDPFRIWWLIAAYLALAFVRG